MNDKDTHGRLSSRLSSEVPSPRPSGLRRGDWLRRRQDGLTTLEWLLIVAAVAGLAALAVVLVQNVVDETAEEITGGNARITAAQVAAATITTDARKELPSNTDNFGNNAQLTERKGEQEAVDKEFRPKCDRLEITFSDVNLATEWHDAKLAVSNIAKGSTREDEKSLPDGNVNNTSGKHALCEVHTA